MEQNELDLIQSLIELVGTLQGKVEKLEANVKAINRIEEERWRSGACMRGKGFNEALNEIQKGV